MLSQNGWPTITAAQARKWIIPGTGRHLVLEPSHAGFVLAYLALWFHDVVERLDLGQWDEWGWAARPVRGSSDISNHASATAEDLNATRHPLGVPTLQTFTAAQARKIRRKLRFLFGLVRWGGDYSRRPDAMHFEIVGTPAQVRVLAYYLARTPRGRRILKANPGYR